MARPMLPPLPQCSKGEPPGLRAFGSLRDLRGPRGLRSAGPRPGGILAGRRMRPSKPYLSSLLPRVRERIESHYGIAVSFVAIAPPFTGDLDGAEVRIDETHESDAAFFTLAHLFGHTVRSEERRVGK